jgi:hypothetical protein
MAPFPARGYILGTVTFFAPEALQVRRTAIVLTSGLPTVRKFARSINTIPFSVTYLASIVDPAMLT